MSQKNLLQFFKPSPKAKRPLSALSDNEDVNTKKSKIEPDQGTPDDKPPKAQNENAKIEGEKASPNLQKTSEEETAGFPESNENIPSVTTPKRAQMTLPFEPTPEKIREEISEMAQKLPVLDLKMGQSWFKALKPEFKKPYFEKLSNFVMSERKSSTIYPPPEKVWTWTKECSLENIKVVILGQDPYHNPNQAHGLCFSVEIGTPPPPSLVNMYKELKTDIEGFTPPKHGYLVGWARQGVLLLNACLTVRKNQPNSHKDKGWEELTTAVIKHLNDHREGIVFLLWGSYAQKKADFVNKKKHHVLKTVHPSPLSANRGWFGSKHFSKCNEILKSIGKRPVDWSKLPAK